MDQFEAAVVAAIESIPASFKPYLENVEFVIQPSSSEDLLGLYEGATVLDTDGWLPDRVTIFKAQHEAQCLTPEDVVAEVRRTILHEVGHHFGMEEADLPY
jgi:predicted Zn-dependent protease with MMP-like domain